jgi:hypothetical protein
LNGSSTQCSSRSFASQGYVGTTVGCSLGPSIAGPFRYSGARCLGFAGLGCYGKG